MFPGAQKGGGGCRHGDQPNWCGRGTCSCSSGITSMAAVAMVTIIAVVAMVTGSEVTSSQVLLTTWPH